MKRISIAVHGRFHAFDLAAALLRSGAEVQLLTNYPRHKVSEWFPAERTRSWVTHGVLQRAAQKVFDGEPPASIEAMLKKSFGAWVANELGKYNADVVHCWSGVAEETLRGRVGNTCTLARGSAHIATQNELLLEEERRTGNRLERPSQWIMEREEREYALADRIIVPSAFAQRTFVQRGVPRDTVRVVNLSLRATGFDPSEGVIQQRLQRLRSGAPLRVLYTGMISYRKGMHDLHRVLESLGKRMEFRLVGPILPECRDFVRAASQLATIQAPVPQRELPDVYAWGDVFLLPTIEDGFAVVLAQAQAAGLPMLCTTNCGGPDIIENGGKGWVVPVRAPDEIVERLRWCDDNREAVATMVEQLHAEPAHRDWDTVARDFLQAVA